MFIKRVCTDTDTGQDKADLWLLEREQRDMPSLCSGCLSDRPYLNLAENSYTCIIVGQKILHIVNGLRTSPIYK